MDTLQGHGYTASHSDEVPPDSDLYLFCTGHEAMKRQAHGWVCLDLRHHPAVDAARWLPYADLCLVHSTAEQAALIQDQGCEPERVHVVPHTEGLLDLLDRVRDGRIMQAEVLERRKPNSTPSTGNTEASMTDPRHQSQSETELSAPNAAALMARLDVAEHHADIMLREYRVHSRVPLVGPVIAWLRRNLTSHLREPYLDPTLEHQVALNQDLVKALKDVSALLANLEERVSQLDGRRDNDRQHQSPH
jgi:hypothetical protein